jgi:hypothetical protein
VPFVLACFQAPSAPRSENSDSDEKDALFGLDTQITIIPFGIVFSSYFFLYFNSICTCRQENLHLSALVPVVLCKYFVTFHFFHHLKRFGKGKISIATIVSFILMFPFFDILTLDQDKEIQLSSVATHPPRS